MKMLCDLCCWCVVCVWCMVCVSDDDVCDWCCLFWCCDVVDVVVDGDDGVCVCVVNVNGVVCVEVLLCVGVGVCVGWVGSVDALRAACACATAATFESRNVCEVVEGVCVV